jgi:hypothetical protein
MAKAKKSDESKPAAEKKQAKKTAAKKSAAPAQPAGMPMIDTGAAAATAASMIRHKVSTENLRGAKKSSAGFQAMKDSLNKSPSTIVGGMLGGAGDKKNQQGHGGFAKQVGHNQTFGADVSRASVPRRTAG